MIDFDACVVEAYAHVFANTVLLDLKMSSGFGYELEGREALR